MAHRWPSEPTLRPLGVTSGAIALGIALIIGLQRPRLAQLLRTGREITPAEHQRQGERTALELRLLQRVPAFGFDNLLANWIFLGYLQYFGDDEARVVTGYGLALEYLEPVIRRDPHFRDAYLFLATGGSLYAAQPQATDDLMAWGLEHLTPQHPPQSYLIWRSRGVNQILFLGDAPAAQASFEQAAAWAATYDDEESQVIATLSQQTAQFLAQNPASKLVQVYAWAMVLNTVPDPPTQQRVIREIERLGGRVERHEQGRFQVLPPPSD